jgi:hypothetical protein
LQAALTPAQRQRQTNIRNIEEFVSKAQHGESSARVKEADESLKLQVASKLLSLAQHLSDPQTVIDLLLSVCASDSDPDMIEKVTPNLCEAVKNRDRFGNASNQDIIDFLESVITRIESDKIADRASATARDINRSEIRLYLACAIIAKNEDLRNGFLRELEKIVMSEKLYDDTRLLLDGIGRTTQTPNLPSILKTVSSFLARGKNPSTPKIAQKS